MRRWEDVRMRRCENEQREDEQMWRWEDVKMRRCEDVKMRRCEDEKMWRWGDVKMWGWGCEDEKMRRCEDEQRRCEDEKMRRWGDVKMWRWEDEEMWRCEDEKMRRCEDEKMRRWDADHLLCTFDLCELSFTVASPFPHFPPRAVSGFCLIAVSSVEDPLALVPKRRHPEGNAVPLPLQDEPDESDDGVLPARQSGKKKSRKQSRKSVKDLLVGWTRRKAQDDSSRTLQRAGLAETERLQCGRNAPEWTTTTAVAGGLFLHERENVDGLCWCRVTFQSMRFADGWCSGQIWSSPGKAVVVGECSRHDFQLGQQQFIKSTGSSKMDHPGRPRFGLKPGQWCPGAVADA